MQFHLQLADRNGTLVFVNFSAQDASVLTSLKGLRLRDLLTFVYLWLPLLWLPLVTIGYHRLPLVTFDYLWSSFLTLLSLSRLAFLGLTRPY